MRVSWCHPKEGAISVDFQPHLKQLVRRCFRMGCDTSYTTQCTYLQTNILETLASTYNIYALRHRMHVGTFDKSFVRSQ